MRFPRWLRRPRRHPSPDAAAARLRAEHSRETAEKALADARRARVEADSVADRIRQHNVANRYDAWLHQISNGGTS